MNRVARSVFAAAMGTLVAATVVWAHAEHGEGSAEEAVENTPAEQTLTGEVVDVFCYLSHGAAGLGQGHAGCAKKCIESGLPVALKVGDTLYLAAMDSHDPANKTLAAYAGEPVTVQGKVMERDGQHLISVTHVSKAD